MRSIRAASTPSGAASRGLAVLVSLEARIAVEGEQEAERRQALFGRRIGEAIDAFRQGRRELSGGERIARRIGSEQGAEERAVFSRQKLQCAGSRLEAAASGEAGCFRADGRLHALPVRSVDKPDRGGFGIRRGERKQDVELLRIVDAPLIMDRASVSTSGRSGPPGHVNGPS